MMIFIIYTLKTMIPFVNDQFQYIMYWSAKSACSTMRRFFIELHNLDLDKEERRVGKSVQDV